MFPERLSCWCDFVCHRIKLKECFVETIPKFLRMIQSAPTFGMTDVDYIVIVSIDKSGREDGEWGAGLRVFLHGAKYFQIYMPMYIHNLHPYVEEFQEDMKESVHIYSLSEPFQDIFYQHNVYYLHDDNESFRLYNEDLRW